MVYRVFKVDTPDTVVNPVSPHPRSQLAVASGLI